MNRAPQTGPDVNFSDHTGEWPEEWIVRGPGPSAKPVGRIQGDPGMSQPIPAPQPTSEIHARHVPSDRSQKSPASWLTSCHRVIGLTEQLGGYHRGLSIKQAMQTREAARDHLDRLMRPHGVI